MGNNASSSSFEGNRTTVNRTPFTRSTGTLGLSKSELEERCKPSGLYPSWQWEDKAIRRLIADGKLAARLEGTDGRVNMTDHECPICFLHYSQVNITQCCSADICTECYLQVRPQREKAVICPFCNHSKLTVAVAKTMDGPAIRQRQLDEQRVIEAKIRAASTPKSSTVGTDGTSDVGGGDSTPTTFGSSLEQNTAVRLMRARSESLSTAASEHNANASEHNNNNDPSSLPSDGVVVASLAPEDRRVLEEEIRAQHTHPLARRMEQEAEERRLANERTYYQSQQQLRSAATSAGSSGRHRRLRDVRHAAELRAARNNGTAATARAAARMSSSADSSSFLLASTASRRTGGGNHRNWNEIVEAFERGSGGGGNHGAEVNTLDDLVVLEAAILLSMAEEGRRREEEQQQHQGVATASAGSNDEATDTSRFDASQHALQGFPLVQSFLADPPTNAARSSSAAAGASVARRSLRARNHRSSQRHDSLATNMSSLMLRGISEAEQIDMAIRLSLEQEQTQQEEDRTTRENNQEEEATAEGSSAAASSLSPAQAANDSTTTTTTTTSGLVVGQQAVQSSSSSSYSLSESSSSGGGSTGSGSTDSQREDSTRSALSSSEDATETMTTTPSESNVGNDDDDNNNARSDVQVDSTASS